MGNHLYISVTFFIFDKHPFIPNLSLYFFRLNPLFLKPLGLGKRKCSLSVKFFNLIFSD